MTAAAAPAAPAAAARRATATAAAASTSTSGGGTTAARGGGRTRATESEHPWAGRKCNPSPNPVAQLRLPLGCSQHQGAALNSMVRTSLRPILYYALQSGQAEMCVHLSICQEVPSEKGEEKGQGAWGGQSERECWEGVVALGPAGFEKPSSGGKTLKVQDRDRGGVQEDGLERLVKGIAVWPEGCTSRGPLKKAGLAAGSCGRSGGACGRGRRCRCLRKSASLCRGWLGNTKGREHCKHAAGWEAKQQAFTAQPDRGGASKAGGAPRVRQPAGRR